MQGPEVAAVCGASLGAAAFVWALWKGEFRLSFHSVVVLVGCAASFVAGAVLSIQESRQVGYRGSLPATASFAFAISAPSLVYWALTESRLARLVGVASETVGLLFVGVANTQDNFLVHFLLCISSISLIIAASPTQEPTRKPPRPSHSKKYETDSTTKIKL